MPLKPIVLNYLSHATKVKSNKGLPEDFFQNVRFGILHAGETRNGSKIRKDGKL